MESEHITLTANTVATVSWPDRFGTIEIVNVDGAGTIYATVDGATPTIAGDDTIVLPAVIGGVELPNGRLRVHEQPGDPHTVVKLISDGTPRVAVRAW